MPKTVRIAVKGLYGGIDELVNVFTFHSDNATFLPEVTDIETWLNTFYTANYLATTDDQVAFARWVMEEAVNSQWIYRLEYPYVKVGTNAGQGLPHMNCALITGITESSRRGKKYIPGIVEDNQSDGILSANMLTVLAPMAVAYRNGFETPDGQWFPGVCRKTGLDFTPFVGARVDTRVHALNKRFPGRGS